MIGICKGNTIKAETATTAARVNSLLSHSSKFYFEIKQSLSLCYSYKVRLCQVLRLALQNWQTFDYLLFASVYDVLCAGVAGQPRVALVPAAGQPQRPRLQSAEPNLPGSTVQCRTEEDRGPTLWGMLPTVMGMVQPGSGRLNVWGPSIHHAILLFNRNSS